VNVALRLISPCPPAFQPIHFAPRTQTVHKSSFAESPTASNPVSNSRFVAPLFSWSYELLFPQTLYIQKHLRCPWGVPPKPLFRTTTTSTCRPSPPILFIINQLRTLVLSCGSFSHSHPLFQCFADSLCKTGGWRTPQLKPQKRKGSRRSLILRAARGTAPCVRMRLSGGDYSTRRSIPAPLVSFSCPLAEVRMMMPRGSVFPVWAMRTLERP